MPHRRNDNTGRKPRAFTLVEAVISLVIVSVMLVSSLALVGATARTRRVHDGQRTGHLLARQLLDEIIHLPYEDPDGPPGIIGREEGGNRDDFDDVDDYFDWSRSPPRRKDDTEISEYGGWTRSALVQFVDPADPAVVVGSDGGLKRIQVTATDPLGNAFQVVALRSRSGAVDRNPDAAKTFAAFMDVELQVGPDAASTLAGGVTLLNEPNDTSNLLTNPGFEAGAAGWGSWNATLLPDADAHAGAGCMRLGSRATPDAEIYQDIAGVVQNGQAYYVEAWVKTDSGNEDLTICIKTIDSLANDVNLWTPPVSVGTSWTKISGTLTPTWAGSLTLAKWRVFSWPAGGTRDFYVDDVMMKEIP